MIKTSCRDCKFAQYKDNIQYSCSKGRLDKFESYGIIKEEAVTDELTHFIIGDLCNYCIDKTSYNTTENPEERLKELTQLQSDFIVVDTDNQDYISTFNKAVLSIHRAIYESIRPKHFIYVMSLNKNFTAENMYNFYDCLNDMLKNTGITLLVSFMAKEDCEFWECIQSVITKIKSRYYSVFESGFNVPYNFNYNLDKEINENLRTFAMFTGFDDKNGWTFNTSVSKEFSHNSNGLLRDKIYKEFIKIDDKTKNRFIVNKEGVFVEPT